MRNVAVVVADEVGDDDSDPDDGDLNSGIIALSGICDEYAVFMRVLVAVGIEGDESSSDRKWKSQPVFRLPNLSCQA